MADPEIIDVHAHTFASADRGIGWQRANGTPNPERNGTIEELMRLNAEAGVSRTVMLMYTPTRFMVEARLREQQLPDDPGERARIIHEVQSIMVARMIENNEWALRVGAEHPEFMNFAGIDPVYQDEQALLAEIDDKLARGSKGVKVVLNNIAIYANDRRFWPVYEHITELGVPIVLQVAKGGGDLAAHDDALGHPRYLAEALEAFPNMYLNLAHVGRGDYLDGIADLCHRFPNFYTDLSHRLNEVEDPAAPMTAESMAALIRQCGPEKVLFGTNYPAVSPVQFARVLRSLPLTDTELELVASGNAKRMLHLA